MTEFRARVCRVIIALRAGEIATYGEVAEESGYPGAARAVGGVLARTDGLPWWRVVAATGRLVPGHESEQAGRLRAEGIGVVGGRAVLSFGVAPYGRRITHPSESSRDRGS